MANELQPVIDLLPEDGSEITYDEWQSRIVATGKPNLLRLTQKCRKAKLVEFRVEFSEDFTQMTGHYVKRAAQGA